MPKSRVEFWQAKFASNVARDARVQEALAAAGWAPVVIWECEICDQDRLVEIICERVQQHPVLQQD